jgi:NADPH-dependent curcumin reductase CurA
MPVCGLVADYNLSELPSGPDRSPVLMRAILTKRLTLRGFIVWDFASMQDDFLRDVGGWLRAGRVKAREDVVEGLDNAPAAFAGMLKGANFGKLVVKVS